MLPLLTALLLSQTTTSFPYSKGVAVQGIASDGGNVQAYGFICGTNMSCSGSQFGWVTLASSGSSDGGGGGGAPTNASYITKVAEPGLSAEFAMASLGAGLVKNTTTTGVPSIYAGTSCTNQFPRSLDSSGAATCASVSLTADVSGTLPQGNGGTGAGALTCTSGQCLTSNGSAYSCTSSITASDVSCSGCVALGSEVSGTLPVGSGGTNLTSATDDDVMVGNGTTWQSKSLAACTDSSGNHLNYDPSSNTFSCGTSQLHDVGGSSPQVQYNNAGVFGGIANVTSDGTHLVFTQESNIPAAPGDGTQLRYGYAVDSGWPIFPMAVEGGGIRGSTPLGMFSELMTTQSGWAVECVTPQGWGQTAVLSYRNIGTVNNTGTAGTVNFDAGGGGVGSHRLLAYTTTLATLNLQAGVRSTNANFWRGGGGASAGQGGFLFWTRVHFHQAGAQTRWFFGALNSLNAFSPTVNPSACTDCVYFGCDQTDTNLNICSNDGSGTATCASLGGSFPCNTMGAWYDLWLYAPPYEDDGGVAGSMRYAIRRIDSAAFTTGSITSDLPTWNKTLAWHLETNNADSGIPTGFGWFGTCFADHH